MIWHSHTSCIAAKPLGTLRAMPEWQASRGHGAQYNRGYKVKQGGTRHD